MTTPEFAAAIGATTRQLSYWIIRGYITPAKRAYGSGHEHEWAVEQLSWGKMLVRAADVWEQVQDQGLPFLAELLASYDRYLSAP